jgi:glutathione peroxidase
MFLHDLVVLHHLTARSLERHEHPLAAYAGKVALVVNTASECGFTPQYAGLEALYRAYKDRGFVVLGFPSNDFGAQEPGTEEEIGAFCRARYDVTFPMFEKVRTTGQGASDVYAFLAAKHGPPKWNFHKYLVGKDGAVRAAFDSGVAPDDPRLRAAIEEALAA